MRTIWKAWSMYLACDAKKDSQREESLADQPSAHAVARRVASKEGAVILVSEATYSAVSLRLSFFFWYPLPTARHVWQEELEAT